jgi:hypothetical protein
MPEILQNGLQRRQPAAVRVQLYRLLQSTKNDERAAAGLRWGHSSLDIVLNC